MNRILIPTDFSEESKNSILYGFQMASDYNLQVTLLHVIDLYKYSAGTTESEIYSELSNDKNLNFFMKQAEESFDILMSELQQQVNHFPLTEIKISKGNLLNSLSDEKEKGDVLFVIVSSSIIKGKAVLSDHTYSLIQKNILPTLLVPIQAKYRGIKTIIYGGSMVEKDIPVANWIAENLSPFGINLHVSHIITDKLDFHKKLSVAGYRAMLSEVSPNIQFTALESDNSVNGIEQVIKTYSPDLLSILVKKKQILKSFVSKTNTEIIAYRLQIPILFFNEHFL